MSAYPKLPDKPLISYKPLISDVLAAPAECKLVYEKVPRYRELRCAVDVPGLMLHW